MATKADEYIEKRAILNEKFEKELVEQASGGIVTEMIGDVKTPDGPSTEVYEADMPQRFETANAHLGLKFTPKMYAAFKAHYDLVVDRLTMPSVGASTPVQDQSIERFDCDIEYIEELITRVANPMSQKML